jgi:hypothetical protein
MPLPRSLLFLFELCGKSVGGMVRDSMVRQTRRLESGDPLPAEAGDFPTEHATCVHQPSFPPWNSTTDSAA